jgi:hypothetical protein
MSISFKTLTPRPKASVHGVEYHFRRQCSTSSNHSDLRSFFLTDCERSTYLEKKSLGLFTTVEASLAVEIDVP